MNYQEEEKNDELRARFTKWMEITLYRAKLDYLKAVKNRNRLLFIEDESEVMKFEDYKSTNELKSIVNGNAFIFTNEIVEEAYYSLPNKEQAILNLLYVEEKDLKEAAKELSCSLRQAYRIKDNAFKKIFEFAKENGYESYRI